MSQPAFFLRPTRIDDGESLNDLYFRLAGIARTVAQWRWEWLDCPGGPAPSWVIVERATGRIVGHHGVVPVTLQLGGKVLAAARTENTMVEPRVRTQLRYPAMEAKLLAELLSKFDVIYTTSGKGAHGMVRKRLGYEAAGRWRTFVAGTTPSYIAGRLAGRLAAAVLAPLGRAVSRRRNDAVLVETTDFAAVARLCAAWSDHAVLAPQRSTEMLRWRINEHPYHRGVLATVRTGDVPSAIIAWHEAVGPGGTCEIHVDDLLAAGSDSRNMTLAVAALGHHYRGRPARLLVRALGAVAEKLEASGFRGGAPNGAELLVRSDCLPRAAIWEGTMLIAEGI